MKLNSVRVTKNKSIEELFTKSLFQGNTPGRSFTIPWYPWRLPWDPSLFPLTSTVLRLSFGLGIKIPLIQGVFCYDKNENNKIVEHLLHIHIDTSYYWWNQSVISTGVLLHVYRPFPFVNHTVAPKRDLLLFSTYTKNF